MLAGDSSVGEFYSVALTNNMQQVGCGGGNRGKVGLNRRAAKEQERELVRPRRVRSAERLARAWLAEGVVAGCTSTGRTGHSNM